MREKDFTYNDLFKSRREISKYVLKNRIFTIFNILLFLLPFLLPLLGWTIYSRYYFMDKLNSDNNLFLYIALNNFPGLFLSFLYGAGLSGVFYTFRRLLYNKTIKISYHFIKGIKESGFEFGLFTSITYIIYTLVDLFEKKMYFLYLKESISQFSFAILFILSILFLFFILYMFTHVLSSASMYVVSFIQAFKDAFNNMFKNFFKRFLIFSLANIPLIFMFIYINESYMILNILSMISFIVLTNAILLFYNLALIYDLFDININKLSYPEYYHDGICRGE